MPIRISAVAVCLCGVLLAQPAPPPAPTNDITLDFVLKDKRGKPIKDLAAADLMITDNGVRRTASKLRLVDGEDAQPRLVTLVFEQLSEDARRLARQATGDLIRRQTAANVYFAVFGINTQLILLQPFTTDRAAAMKAVERATGGTPLIRFAGQSEELKQSLEALCPKSPEIDRQLAQMALDMTRGSVSTPDPSRASISSLLSLLRGSASMSGRKTFVYLSAGLYVPPELDLLFRALISAANHARVAMYPVDTRGVLTARQSQGVTTAIRQAAADTRADLSSADGRITTDQILAADHVESGMRNHLGLPLREIAESTGGLLIAETNSFERPMEQVASEIDTYYEVTYDPAIVKYDGQWRKTEVRARADGKVRARSGYAALARGSQTSGPPPFEDALMKALESSPLANDLPMRVSAIRFAASGEGTHQEVLIEIPLSNVRFKEDAVSKVYSAHLSVLAVVKTARGEVVRRMSRDLPLWGPIEQAGATRQGNFLYKDHFTAPPGGYVLEAAVMDGETGRIGANRAPLLVGAKPRGVALSGMTLIRRYQPKASDLDAAEDFEFQGGRITPTLSNTVKAGKGAILPVFFVVYPDVSMAEKPSLVIEYARGGRIVARASADLPPADGRGRIAYVMSSPAETLPAGVYEIRDRASGRNGGRGAHRGERGGGSVSGGRELAARSAR